MLFRSRWMSLLPYFIALVFCLIVMGLALARVNTTPLQKDSN